MVDEFRCRDIFPVGGRLSKRRYGIPVANSATDFNFYKIYNINKNQMRGLMDSLSQGALAQRLQKSNIKMAIYPPTHNPHILFLNGERYCYCLNFNFWWRWARNVKKLRMKIMAYLSTFADRRGIVSTTM